VGNQNPANFLHAKLRDLVEANGFATELPPYQSGVKDGGRCAGLNAAAITRRIERLRHFFPPSTGSIGPIRISMRRSGLMRRSGDHLANLDIAIADRLIDEAPPHLRQAYEFGAGQPRRHRAVIARFGRQPHRNAVLRRASSIHPSKLDDL
jgi:hypothetical protein